MNTLQADYDSPWKDALDFYFEDFLAFFFPQVHQLIDWTKTPIPLDKELQQVVREAESGKGFTDKLFKVWLVDGVEVWILVHVEVQSQVDYDFPQRMYRYNYRLFDRYERPVISLAVLGDEQKSWRPSAYSYELGGCRVSLEFPTVKLLDYEEQWAELEQNNNPFAVLVMAHLKTKATTGNYPAREQWKWRLVRGLYERGYNRKEILQLFRLLDWMMVLPEGLQNQFEDKLENYQEERKMPVLSRIEVRAMERGEQRGEQRGKLLNAREWVIKVLETRFEDVPEEIQEAINQLEDISHLEQLLKQAITISSVADFQRLLD
jgi:hypothetical protein